MVAKQWELEYFDKLLSITDNSDFMEALNEPGKRGMKPIHIAAATQNLNFLKKYSSFNENECDNDGNTIAHYASYFDALESLKLIKTISKDCFKWKNNKKQTPPQLAFANNSTDILFAYQDEFSSFIHDCDVDGNNTLLLSANCNDAISWQMLLKMGVNPHSTNNIGDTLLHRVIQCEGNILEKFETALDMDFKLQVNAQNQAGCTPLHLLCVHQSDGDLMRILSRTSVDVNIPDKQGDTALHYCAFLKKNEYLKQLLYNHNIDIFCKNLKGRTALDTAAFAGNLKAVKKLLKRANIERVDKSVFF